MYNDADQSTLGIGEVEEAIGLIEQKYYRDIDKEKMVSVALKAITDELDPFSSYIPKRRVPQTSESLTDSIRGIGVELYKIRDTFVVTYLVPDNAAINAGMKIGDKVLAINDKVVVGPTMSFDSLRDELLRKSSATIDRMSLGTKEPSRVTLDLQKISNQDQSIGFAINDSIGFIKLDKFNDNSYESFMQRLESLVGESRSYDLIIDVRENLGGYLMEVIQILQQLFSDKNIELLKTKGENSPEKIYKSRGNPFYNIDQLIVLIDDRSASASEILSGVVQDLDRGIVVGDTSFGKGLVQEQFYLDSEAALRLTTSHYYLPSGRKIQYLFKAESEDSLTYKTRKLRRILSGQNGIIPDVLLESKVTNSWFSNYADIIEHSFTINPESTLSVAEIEQKYSLPTSFLDGQNEINEFRKDLFHSLLIQKAKGKSSALRFEIMKDPVVQRSIELIMENADFENYLRLNG